MTCKASFTGLCMRKETLQNIRVTDKPSAATGCVFDGINRYCREAEVETAQIPNDSLYDDVSAVAQIVESGQHREVVGGLWEQLGALQVEFLTLNGLQPAHHLLDIGCGCLRGGVKFAAYLQPGHYWGMDRNASLIDSGYDIELKGAGLCERVPRSNLVCDGEFDFEVFGRIFDMAIAQSLFTHLSLNRIRLCMERLAVVTRPSARFFATYFEAPAGHPGDAVVEHDSGVRTFGDKDPFHYEVAELEKLMPDIWRLVSAGAWGHPRGQHMAIFQRI